MEHDFKGGGDIIWLPPTSPITSWNSLPLAHHEATTQASQASLATQASFFSSSNMPHLFFTELSHLFSLTETNSYMAGFFSSFTSLLKCIFLDNQYSYPIILCHFILFSFIEINNNMFRLDNKINMFIYRKIFTSLNCIILLEQDCRAPWGRGGKKHPTFTHPATYSTKWAFKQLLYKCRLCRWTGYGIYQLQTSQSQRNSPNVNVRHLTGQVYI